MEWGDTSGCYQKRSGGLSVMEILCGPGEPFWGDQFLQNRKNFAVGKKPEMHDSKNGKR